MHTRASISIDVIRSTPDLEALRPHWKRLWLDDPHAKPFQAPEWLLPWWSSFGQPDLRTLAIWRGNELLAILPLYIYEEPTSGERKLLLIGAGTSDYLDGVFSRACTSAHILAALDLLRTERDWDVAHFSQLLPHSPLFQALQLLDRQCVTAHVGERCWSLPAVSRTELPSKIRHDLRNHRKFIKDGGELDAIVADQDNWEPLFAQLVRLHRERWERVGESGVLADAAVLAWHRKALPELIASGLGQLIALRVKGEVSAVLYALLDTDARAIRTQYMYLIGHSAKYAQLRPGTLLMALGIEQAAAEGVQCIDLLRGDENYKRFWHAQQTSTYGFALHAHPQRHLRAPGQSPLRAATRPRLTAATNHISLEP